MKHKIEHLAESLVLADPGDLQSIARLHDLFGDIIHLANELQDSVVVSASTAAARILEQIIMKEFDDVAGALEVINDTVTSLQAIVSEGRSADDVTFPSALGLAPNPNTVNSSELAMGGGQMPSLPSNVDESIFKEFLSNCPGVLDDMETHVLTLEEPEEAQEKDALLRLLHTLKGESGLMGLVDIERLCHNAEDAIANRPAADITDLLLETKDWILRTVNAYSGKGDGAPPVDDLIARLLDNEPTSDNGSDESVSDSVTPPSPPESSDRDDHGDGDDGNDDDDETPQEPYPLTGDPELMGEFISEAFEHLESSDTHLLTIETTPEDNDALNAVFRAFHTIKGVAGFLDLPDIQALAHEAENLLDGARMGQILLQGTALDVTFDAVDMMKTLVGFAQEALGSGKLVARAPGQLKLIKRIQAAKLGKAQPEADSSPKSPPPVESGQPLGEILKESGLVSQKEITEALEKQTDEIPPPRLGEVLIKEGKITPKEVAHALRSQNEAEHAGLSAVSSGSTKQPTASSAAQAPTAAKKTVKVTETVRVDSFRLDAMVDMIGEMVIAEAMVSQSPEICQSGTKRLTRLLTHLDKITRELQDMATSLRMMPIRPTFQRMARLVRDVAKKTNKKVNFTMNGEETELDKSVVDQIGDPLVHMVRNSVDHGIEPTIEERRKAGKPDIGHVELRAFHRSGSIYIEIEDDGRGLNRELILAKAKERGLVREGDKLTDSEIYNMVFEPGFSTAKVVSDVSGRGVGMDVVKRNIQAMRGQVVITSTPGKGSIFSIRLPLTLAIIEGMIVQVGSQRFILPLLLITRMLRPDENGIPTVFGTAEMLSLSDGLIPLYRLHRIFKINDAITDPQKAAVVIIEYEGRRCGILVDDLLGQQQIVIKSLGGKLKNTECIAGGAIMPDGRVGLIIDMDSLLKVAGRSQQADNIAA